MARVLKKFNFNGCGTARYPYATWSDGRIWQATKGKDYDCGDRSFCGHLYYFAAQHKLKCRCRVADGVVTFQFYKSK